MLRRPRTFRSPCGSGATADRRQRPQHVGLMMLEPLKESHSPAEPRRLGDGSGLLPRTREPAVPLRIGVDMGGTFTDLAALDEATGTVVNAKALSTPSALLDGVLRCAVTDQK